MQPSPDQKEIPKRAGNQQNTHDKQDEHEHTRKKNRKKISLFQIVRRIAFSHLNFCFPPHYRAFRIMRSRLL